MSLAGTLTTRLRCERYSPTYFPVLMYIRSDDLDEHEMLQFSLRGRTFLEFRVVIGTVELTAKDLVINTSDGTFIVVRWLCVSSKIIIVIS